MRLNVAALREAADQTARRLRDDHDQRVADQVREAEEKAERWLEDYAAEWDAAALAIRRKVKKGWPVLASDLPTAADRHFRQFDQVALFSPPTIDAREWREPAALSSLVTVLATIADDTVTVAALRDLGISPGMLREVVSQLRAKSISSK